MVLATTGMNGLKPISETLLTKMPKHYTFDATIYCTIVHRRST